MTSSPSDKECLLALSTRFCAPLSAFSCLFRAHVRFAQSVAADFASTTTVGIGLKGCCIESCTTGIFPKPRNKFKCVNGRTPFVGGLEGQTPISLRHNAVCKRILHVTLQMQFADRGANRGANRGRTPASPPRLDDTYNDRLRQPPINVACLQLSITGGPGWHSRQLDVGDLIMQVDGLSVSTESIVRANTHAHAHCCTPCRIDLSSYHMNFSGCRTHRFR